jgi:hypothetical protein
MTAGNVPLQQLQDGQLLTSDALVDLFQVTLVGAPSPTVVRFTAAPSVTWQGNFYQLMACKLSGVQRSTSGQLARPTLTVLNPAGIFNAPALAGYFEGAQFIQYRVLYQHVVQDVAIFRQLIWRVSRVFGIIAGQSISFELRTISDGPQFVIPARKYMPDAGFPFVTLG